MAKINILPSKVYNRIAAGEVIERPCSVVKELVENAIDAGATEIEIVIENGGKELVRVTDNGCGIAREDLHSAFLPHATSKIATAEDLDGVLTLGFRGEAVASIASVSKMTIVSKTEGNKCYRLSSAAGEIGQIEETAGRLGTEVSVETLFYNAPVRLKFLKTDKGEEAEITNLISRFILNRADIAFTYYANGKKVLQSFGGGLEEALVCVYGAATLRECFHIDATKHGVRVYGYIGNQNYYKANKSYQSVFLNGRYITNGTIASAVSNAYGAYMMKRQYPFYVLHVEVPREIVDVNVHPNKADVRFADNQIIYGCIYSIISSILDGHTKALDYIVEDKSAAVEPAQEPIQEAVLPKATIKTEKPTVEKSAKTEKTFGFSTFTYEEAQKEIEKCAPVFSKKEGGTEVPFGEVVKNQKGYIPMSELEPYVPSNNSFRDMPPRIVPSKNAAEKLHEQFPDLYFKRNLLQVDDPEKDKKQVDYFAENKKYLEELDKKNKQNRIDVSSCKYAGKLFNTYLMYERQDEIYIIDQHAAHERLIFDRLKEQMKKRKVLQQPMLVPFEMPLNAFEGDFIRERAADIRAMGFDMDESDENVFRVTAVPLDLQNINLTVFFNDILGHVKDYRSIKLADLLKDKLASAACKAAVKGGMDLTQEEIEALFALMDGDMGLKCPHGRPVVVKMTRAQLEKMFKRIV